MKTIEEQITEAREERAARHYLKKCAHTRDRDRLTILRGTAYLPVASVDETEAESGAVTLRVASGAEGES